MNKSVRRLHVLSEALTLTAVVASVAVFSQLLANALWRQIEAGERDSLARSAIFLENQLEDRLELFAAYADDAFRGVAPSAPADIDAGLILNADTLAVIELLPARDSSTFFVGYSLANSAPGRFFSRLKSAERAHSGVIRSPERDGLAIYYGERRDDRLVLGLSGISSITKVLRRASELEEGAYLLSSADGFSLVNAVPGAPAVLRRTEEAEGMSRQGEWYVTSLAAPKLGGVLHKFRPSAAMDTFIILIRLSALPLAALLGLFALAKYLVQHRLIIVPLEKLAASLASWPDTSINIQAPMARELRTVYEGFASAQQRIQEAIASLSGAKDALALNNAELETRVAARTEGLNGALEALTRVQDRLVAQEKMAALGQLSAGVAHELNTPLGAILSAVGSGADAYAQDLAGWIGLLRSLPEADALIADALLRGGIGQPASSANELRARARALRPRLRELGIEDSWALAASMAELGLHGDSPLFAPVLASERREDILRFVTQALSLHKALGLIRLAAENAAKVVSALKSYSWEGDSKAIAYDVTDQLRDVLTIMGDRLRRGFTLDLQFADGLIVFADPDRIVQVWINIISNALGAMGSSGRLTVKAERVGPIIRVGISDDGPGIAPDIQDRVFEPFFTTKAKGEGTGLGLDICRRLVDDAAGSMYFESQPGRTTFYVDLPANE
jgi:two-component system, NtrC family, sensor kinase